jgi:outer membrane protein TolC
MRGNSLHHACLATFAGLVALSLAWPGAVEAQRRRRRQPDPPEIVDRQPTGLEAELRALVVPGGLTSDSVAERAMQVSPQTDRAEALAAAAEAAANRAMYLLIPQIDITGRYTALGPTNNTPIIDPFAGNFCQTGGGGRPAQLVDALCVGLPISNSQIAVNVRLTYPVTTVFARLLPAYQSAHSAERAAHYQEIADRRNIVMRAREAYYQFMRAMAAKRIVDDAVGRIEVQRDRIATLVRGGLSSRLDLLSMEAQLASARVAVADATRAAGVAREALALALYIDDSSTIQLGEDLSRLPDVPEVNIPDLVRTALRQRPEIKAMKLLVKARDQMVSSERGAAIPQLGLQANVDVANPNLRFIPQEDRFRTTWDVSAILRLSLGDILDASARTGQARASLAQARADLHALEDAVHLEVVQAIGGMVAARGQIEAGVLGVEAAKEQWRTRDQQMQAGVGVQADLLDAESQLRRSQLELVDAAIQLHLASARLEHALGEDTLP